MNPAAIDFILNGQAHGNVAEVLRNVGGDHNLLRPFCDDAGKNTYVNVHNGQYDAKGGRIYVPKLISNAPSTMRKDDWILLDRVLLEAAKPRLQLVAALRSRGLTYNLPNGMAHTVLQYQDVGEISPATLSMDPVRESERDRPEYDIKNLPLPIIHKDFSFGLREIMVSRNGGSPLDTTMVSMSGRVVAELAEKLALGTYGTYKFGGGTIYGLVNYPQRLTQELTNPESTPWTGKTFIGEVLQMKQKSMDNFYYGPWILFTSPAWDAYLDADYSDAKGDNTVRERVQRISGIQAVQTLDFLSGYQAILLQLSPEVIREIIGMDITTVQWETHGGFKLNFKVLAMMLPQLRSDQNGHTGIVHGSADSGDLD